jgi:hypothetical protein
MKWMDMGKADLYDKLQSDHPFTAVMPDNICWIDNLIHSLYCITTDVLCATVSNGKGVVATIRELGCVYKDAYKTITIDLLCQSCPTGGTWAKTYGSSSSLCACASYILKFQGRYLHCYV